MALSEDLLKKLNQKDISLCDRLNAGKNLFCTSEINYINRKEDLVLNWLCNLLRKRDSVEVWKIVQDCLSSAQMQKIKALDIKGSTKEAICKIMSNSSQSHHPVLQECAFLCLESAVFQQHFRSHRQNFINIIQILLKCIGNSGKVDAFIRYSKDLRLFTKKNFGSEMSFIMFVENFLVPSVEAFTLLEAKLEEDPISIECTNQIIPEINQEILDRRGIEKESVLQKEAKSELKREFIKLVQEIIFSGSVNSAILQLFSTRLNIKSDNQKVDFLCLCLSSIVSAFPEKVVINLYSVIFQAFIQSYPSRSQFPFFVFLCSFLGFCPSVEVNSNLPTITLSVAGKTLENPKSKVSFLVLKNILACLMEADVMFDSKVRNISFLQWLQALALDVISCKLSSLTYQIVYYLGQLNPLIVAPVMSKVLARLLFQVKPTKEEKDSYKCFIQGTFDNFTKLNQIPELVGNHILPTLKQAIQGSDLISGHRVTISDMVPEGSLAGFTRCVLTLPNTVCVSLLKTFVQHLVEDILEAIEGEGNGGGCWLVLEVLARLLEAFFAGVRLAEQTVPKPTRTAFVSELLKFRTALGSIGHSLLQREHNSEALAPFLRMCHTCGEIQLLLLWYSPLSEQGAQLQPDDVSAGNSIYDLHCLHSFLSSEEWKSIGERVETSNSEACRKMMDNLLLQKLNLLAAFSSNLKQSTQMRAALCKHILENIDGWWLLFLGKQSSTLTSLLTPEQFFEVAETVANKLLCSKKDKIEELENPYVQENQPFVVALSWVIIQRISQLFQKKRRRDTDVVDHDQLVGDVVKQVEPVTALLIDAETDAGMKVVPPQMAALINVAWSAEEESKVPCAFILDVKSLEVHLSVLKRLPLLLLPKLIRHVLTMPILAVIVCLNKRASTEEPGQIALARHLCLEILLVMTEFGFLSVKTSVLDPGKLVQQLYSCSSCPPEVLQPIFTRCLNRSEKFEKLVAGAHEVDSHLGANSVPLSLHLLQYVKNFSKLMKQEAHEKCVKQLTKTLLAWVLHHLNAEKQKCTVPMLDAYSWLLLCWAGKSKKAAKLLLNLDTVVSAALSIVREAGEEAAAVHQALAFLETVVKSRPHLGEEQAKNFVVTIFHASRTTSQKDSLAPRIAHLLSNASEEEFSEIMQHLSASEDMKYSLILLQHLVKLHLPSSLSRLRNLAVIQVFEDLYKAFVQGNLRPVIAEALALEQAIAVKMIRTLSRVFDMVLLTVMVALEIQSEPVEKFAPVCLSAMQLLSGLAHLSFPVIEERIPSFLQTIRRGVHAVVAYSGTERQLTGSNLETMTNCANYIERLCRHLVGHKETFKNVAHFAVADILLELTEAAVHHEVKRPLMKSLYSLFELCDPNSEQHLLHALPVASMELYKKYNTEYQKFYRYKGKV